jgi:hypothetical protein
MPRDSKPWTRPAPNLGRPSPRADDTRIPAPTSHGWRRPLDRQRRRISSPTHATGGRSLTSGAALFEDIRYGTLERHPFGGLGSLLRNLIARTFDSVGLESKPGFNRLLSPSLAGTLLTLALLIGMVGCGQSIRVRSTRTDQVVRRYTTVLNNNLISDRTKQWLRRNDFETMYQRDPVGFLTEFDRRSRRGASRDDAFAIAELAHQTGRRREMMDKPVALRLYLVSVAYSYFYLFDPAFGEPASQFDPRFRQACDLYNRSLARTIRLIQSRNLLSGKRLRLDSKDEPIELEIVRRDTTWSNEEFEELLIAGDYEVAGLENRYETYGLGVPLIARRHRANTSPGREKFFPDEACFPVTAFLRMDCKLHDEPGAVRHARLELYDPLTVRELEIAGRPVPLESDLTTPLGYFLSNAKLDGVASLGLFRADALDSRTGLYFVEPYDPQRIPVVFVHGLWSSPLTWMKMFNDLRGDPVLRRRYQFWFFLYPTGSPMLYSASRLRQALSEALDEFDPKRSNPALADMVVIGHSMGGLIARTQVQSSDRFLWDVVATRPVEQLKGPEEEREAIRRIFFFEPQPFISRTVFIATPHRGSNLSKATIGRLTDRLIRLPNRIMTLRERLISENPDAFTELFKTGPTTSVDNLDPDSPLIRQVSAIPVTPGVRFHSIIGQEKAGPPEQGSDGVVSYWSSHLAEAETELIVQSNHNAHEHPLAVNEVRRILLLHLKEIADRSALKLATHVTEPTEPSQPAPVPASPTTTSSASSSSTTRLPVGEKR